MSLWYVNLNSEVSLFLKTWFKAVPDRPLLSQGNRLLYLLPLIFCYISSPDSCVALWINSWPNSLTFHIGMHLSRSRQCTVWVWVWRQVARLNSLRRTKQVSDLQWLVFVWFVQVQRNSLLSTTMLQSIQIWNSLLSTMVQSGWIWSIIVLSAMVWSVWIWSIVLSRLLSTLKIIAISSYDLRWTGHVQSFWHKCWMGQLLQDCLMMLQYICKVVTIVQMEEFI